MATGPTTRAAAQQQKVEEHLAVILQRLDMQKAELDQRSVEQERVSQERHLQLQQLLQTELSCRTEGRASAAELQVGGAESLL